MIYERPPSHQQRAIIEEPNLEVPLKIVAGAGTGKTFVLAHRFVWLVVEKGVPADRILALTFNDNAATEMRTRIRRLLRLNHPSALSTCDFRLPTLWVHTFHSFAARILRENAYTAGHDPEPKLITEIDEALYLDGLLQAVFQGDFATITALSPDRLAELGVERPDDLRGLLLRLVREAKGRGLLPDDFRKEAQAQTEKFWKAVPSAPDAHALDQHDLAPLLYRRAAAGFGLPPRPAGDLPKDVTLPLRKLYFADTGRKSPTLLPETQLLLDRAQAAELALIDAATEVYRLYLDRLEQESALDFDGQITQAVALLRDPHLRLSQYYQSHFQYLLVDEFQDTSPNQLDLVRLLARPRPGGTYARLLVVGDQKQSIYGWRNARPGNIDKLLPMEAGATVDGVEVFRPLTESYRLTAPIVEIANRAGRAARPMDPPLVARNPAEGRVIYPEPFAHEHGARYAKRTEAAYIADQIVRLRDSGEIADLSEVAVLIRSRSRFRPLKVAFERRGLLYQAQGGVGFFEHPLARDVLAWLQVLRDPQQDLYLTRLLTRAPYTLSDRALYLLLTEPHRQTRRRRQGSVMEIVLEYLRAGRASSPPSETEETAPRGADGIAAIPAARLQAFADQYAALRDLSRAASAPEVLEAVWRHCAAHVLLTPSEERATGVVRATFEGLIEQVSATHPAHLDDLVNALDLYLADDYRELPVADQPLRGAVQVMTIHRAKGLGFPAVFLLGWNEPGQSGPFYDSRWGVRGIKVNGQDPKGVICKFLDKVSPREESDESLRLAYVGLTRGERILCVTRAADRSGKPPQHPAEDYFAGVEPVPAEVPPITEQERPLVRPAPAPVLARDSALAPRLLRVSFTQLRRLEQCPRAWLLYRQAPGGGDTPEGTEAGSGAEVGSRFHRFVAAHYRGATPEADTTGLDEAEAQRLGRLIAGFLVSDWSRLAEPAEVEVPLSLGRRVGEAVVVLSGVADLLLPQSGRLADFKTDREMAPTLRAEHALQMLIYRQALAVGGQPPHCLLLHARPDRLEPLMLSEEELAAQEPRLESLLQSLVEYAAGKPTEPRVGEHCRWCLFREVCGVR